MVNPQTIRQLAKFFKIPAEELAETVEDTSPATWDGREEFGTLLAQVRKVFGKIDFIGLAFFQDEKPLELNALYVPPQFADREVKPPDLPVRAGGDLTLHDLTPQTVLGWGKRVVCQAGPGYGKSSFVKWMAMQLAAVRRNEWRATFDDAIPFPLILRELRLTKDVDTWAKLLAQVRFAQFDADAYVNPAKLEVAFQAGRVFVLLDGMDEISGEVRIALHKAIWDGMRKHPECRWLVTSRVQGYELAPLEMTPYELRVRERLKVTQFDLEALQDIGWTTVVKSSVEPAATSQPETNPRTVYFAPFDDGRIRLFAEHWYLQREPTAKLALERAADLWESVSVADDTHRLARVPNLLSLMALVHRNRALLPRGRAELYEKIADSYVETIDQHRKVADNRFTPVEMQQWLSHMAYRMQEGRDWSAARGDLLVPHERILELIREAMKASPRRFAADDAEVFLKRMLERSGLLIEQGQGLYAFIHLTFLEYFAARHILHEMAAALRSGDEDGFIEKLTERLDQRHWHETFTFLFQLLRLKNDHLLHRDVRRKLFGQDWDQDGTIEKLGNMRKLLLLELANDPYTWFDLPYDPKAPEGKKVDQVVGAGIRKLDLSHTNVSDMTILVRGIGLMWLNLNSSQVGDAGAATLAKMTGLTALYLCGTAVTDVGAAALAQMTGLSTLELSGTAVTDTGVTALAQMTGLTTLALRGTAVTDTGVTALAQMTGLTSLHLSNTSVSDVGIAALAQMTRLTTLALSGTAVTDAGVADLAKNSGLTRLGLYATRVTKTAVAALHKTNSRLAVFGVH